MPNLGIKIRLSTTFIINPGNHIKTAFQGKPFEAKNCDIIVHNDKK